MFENVKKFLWIQKKSFTPIYYGGGLQSLFSNKKNLNLGELLELYTGYSFVCINAISQGIVWLDKTIFTDASEDTILNHKYLELITDEYLENLVGMLEITGIAYTHIVRFWKNIEKLEVLRSDLVQKKKGDDFYLYFKDGWLKRIDEQDVFYIKTFSPFLSKVGYSPLQAIAKQQTMDDSILDWNLAFFENGASSGTTLTTDQELSNEKKEYLVAKWKTEFMGKNNAHKVAVLDKGLKQEKQEIWQKEMDFVNQRTMIRDEIFTIFRVPKVIVWITDGVGYTDRLIGKQNFAEYVLNPLAKKIEHALNQNVFKGVWIFRFLNVIPLDYEQLAKDYTLGAITLDEYRIRTGYDNVKNGNRTIDGEILEVENNGSYNVVYSGEDKKYKDLAEKINKDLQDNFKKKELVSAKEKKLQANRYKKIKRTNNYEKKFKATLKKLFDFQKSQILKNLDAIYNKKSYNDLAKIKKGDLWNSQAMDVIIGRLFAPLLSEIYINENKISFGDLVEIYSEAVGDYWEIEPVLFTQEKVNNMFKKQIKTFKGINDTTSEEILDIVKNGYKTGLWYDKIVSEITNKFVEYNKSRINKIARTEVSHAVNYTRLETREDSGRVQEKEWWTALDERTCEECQELHGKKIPLDANFYGLGDRTNTGRVIDYEDVSAPPTHVNCRCDIIPVI